MIFLHLRIRLSAQKNKKVPVKSEHPHRQSQGYAVGRTLNSRILSLDFKQTLGTESPNRFLAWNPRFLGLSDSEPGLQIWIGPCQRPSVVVNLKIITVHV